MSIDHSQVIADFSSGISMPEIGRRNGVSRQRVQQILRKHGLRKEDGGHAVKMATLLAKRAADKKAKANEQCLNRYGCTHDEFLRIPLEARSAYGRQKANAGHRKIGWAFTLYTWWQVWEKSGMWEARGRGSGSCCMARRNDIGIYSPDNVYICTNHQNMSDYYETDLYHSRKKGLRETPVSV